VKGILEFELPQENEEFETAAKGWRYKVAIDQLWEEMFRPRHKHGYYDKLQKLVETETGEAIMEELERLYLTIIEDVR
jgi:hypothetical protein